VSRFLANGHLIRVTSLGNKNNDTAGTAWRPRRSSMRRVMGWKCPTCRLF